jgi:hypothetical protein
MPEPKPPFVHRVCLSLIVQLTREKACRMSKAAQQRGSESSGWLLTNYY